ncbi:MAG: xanthine dehydrogenase family protein molybdopterin-binding subunit [Pseudomonadota bacterium]
MRIKDQIPQIGRTVARVDAFDKVKGLEKYAADYYGREVLCAGVKRAGIPSGILRKIHSKAALRVPGILNILTHKDVKGTNRQGVIRKDQPVLVEDRVRHCGDAVALVIAEDRKALERAVGAIELELQPLPGIFDPEEALKEDAPRVHEDNPEGNILLHGIMEKGDAGTAFKECDCVVEGCFELPHQEHACLETENGRAVLGENGRLEIIASTQTPFRDRAEVAEALGMDMDRIRIIAPYCGGAFGGKDGITVQSLLALAALHCPGRPVKMWWSREESFLASVKRHPARLYYRLGAKKDGAFHALDARLYYDTGPYDHLGGAIMALGMEHAGGPYKIPHVRLRAWAVFTNNPIGGAFRGFGVPQVTGAMEQMVDMAAAKLAMEPLELRMKNGIRRGDRNPIGVIVTGSTGLQDCLETLKGHPDWFNKDHWKSGAGPFKSRGVGIAAVMHGMGYGPVVPDVANAKIELTGEGIFRIYCGVADMGQGNVSTCLQIAGDILNQNMDDMEAVLHDTDRTLPSARPRRAGLPTPSEMPWWERPEGSERGYCYGRPIF